MRLRNDKREERKVEGELRNQEWRSLTPTRQLEILDQRLGVGMGAKRQRAKLAPPEEK